MGSEKRTVGRLLWRAFVYLYWALFACVALLCVREDILNREPFWVVGLAAAITIAACVASFLSIRGAHPRRLRLLWKAVPILFVAYHVVVGYFNIPPLKERHPGYGASDIIVCIVAGTIVMGPAVWMMARFAYGRGTGSGRDRRRCFR